MAAADLPRRATDRLIPALTASGLTYPALCAYLGLLADIVENHVRVLESQDMNGSIEGSIWLHSATTPKIPETHMGLRTQLDIEEFAFVNTYVRRQDAPPPPKRQKDGEAKDYSPLKPRKGHVVYEHGHQREHNCRRTALLAQQLFLAVFCDASWFLRLRRETSLIGYICVQLALGNFEEDHEQIPFKNKDALFRSLSCGSMAEYQHTYREILAFFDYQPYLKTTMGAIETILHTALPFRPADCGDAERETRIASAVNQALAELALNELVLSNHTSEHYWSLYPLLARDTTSSIIAVLTTFTQRVADELHATRPLVETLEKQRLIDVQFIQPRATLDLATGKIDTAARDAHVPAYYCRKLPVIDSFEFKQSVTRARLQQKEVDRAWREHDQVGEYAPRVPSPSLSPVYRDLDAMTLGSSPAQPPPPPPPPSRAVTQVSSLRPAVTSSGLKRPVVARKRSSSSSSSFVAMDVYAEAEITADSYEAPPSLEIKVMG